METPARSNGRSEGIPRARADHAPARTSVNVSDDTILARYAGAKETLEGVAERSLQQANGDVEQACRIGSDHCPPQLRDILYRMIRDASQ